MTDTTTTAPTLGPTPTPEQLVDLAAGAIVVPEGWAMRETTIAELDNVLPGSGLPFVFHRPTLGTLKRLGNLGGDAKLQKKPAVYVSNYLAAALKELGGDNMGAVSRSAKGAALIAGLPLGDVLTLMISWTRARNRRGVPLTHSGCSACGHGFEEVRLDLGGIQVRALPEGATLDQARAAVGLYTGFEWKDREHSAVLLQPPLWGATYHGLHGNAWGNDLAIQAATLQASIIATDTLPRLGRLPVEAVDELLDEDMEQIGDGLDQIIPTPDLVYVVECPACGAPNMGRLPWRNLGFFGGLASA